MNVTIYDFQADIFPIFLVIYSSQETMKSITGVGEVLIRNTRARTASVDRKLFPQKNKSHSSAPNNQIETYLTINHLL